jgi:hypothetical protein
MSKAEKRAHECYPDDDVASIQSRFGFLLGYQQAEKDLELTWKDMLLLADIEQDVFNHSDSPLKGVQAAYEEVLKRFKEEKEKRHKDENIGI